MEPGPNMVMATDTFVGLVSVQPSDDNELFVYVRVSGDHREDGLPGQTEVLLSREAARDLVVEMVAALRVPVPVRA